MGIVTALVVWVFVREPMRGGLDAPMRGVAAADAPPKAPFWPTCRKFFADPVLLRVSLACGATQFVTYATLNFTTLFLMREKGMTLGEIAIYYALVVGVSVCLGMYTSGRLIDRFAPRSKQAYAYLPAVALALAIPFFIGFIAAPGWPLALAFLAFPMFFNYFYLSPAVTLVQEEVQPHERVLAGALLLLVMNLIGLGLGPTFLGAVSDYFRPSHPQNSLQLAFYTLVPFYVVAVLGFLWLARAIKCRGKETRAEHPRELVTHSDAASRDPVRCFGVGHARSRRYRRRQFTRRQTAGDHRRQAARIQGDSVRAAAHR